MTDGSETSKSKETYNRLVFSFFFFSPFFHPKPCMDCVASSFSFSFTSFHHSTPTIATTTDAVVVLVFVAVALDVVLVCVCVFFFSFSLSVCMFLLSYKCLYFFDYDDHRRHPWSSFGRQVIKVTFFIHSSYTNFLLHFSHSHHTNKKTSTFLFH